MFDSLRGKAVLITGASGGIGSCMARLFAERGCRVGFHYHAGGAQARRLIQELPQAAKPHVLLRADLTKRGACRKLIQKCVRKLGGLDVLINNAGALRGQAPVEELSEKNWEAMLRLNATAPFLLSQSAFGHMKKNGGGRIVNISSIGVKFGGFPRSAHYAAAKAALESATTAFARAGAAYEILVNAIRPGVIDTPFHKKAPKDMSARISLIPLRRAGRPIDVARMALYLASSGGDFITGQTFSVTGGE